MTTSLGAGLRLPRRDPSTSTPCCPTRAGEPYDDHATRSACTRRTTPCSGSTSTPSTGAEVRRMRRMVVSVPRHRRQLRVPRLLALLPGRQHRVRGARHRDHGHHPDAPRATTLRRTAPWSTSAPTRRSTSTSWSPGSTWTSTARTTRWSRSTRSPRRSAPSNPYGLALTTQATPDRVGERESGRDFNWETQRGLEGGQPGQDEPARHPRRLQAGARRRVPGR